MASRVQQLEAQLGTRLLSEQRRVDSVEKVAPLAGQTRTIKIIHIGSSNYIRRNSLGDIPTWRLNARLKDASDS